MTFSDCNPLNFGTYIFGTVFFLRDFHGVVYFVALALNSTYGLSGRLPVGARGNAIATLEGVAFYIHAEFHFYSPVSLNKIETVARHYRYVARVALLSNSSRHYREHTKSIYTARGKE